MTMDARPLDVLIVAPINEGSGETVTARYLARELTAEGHRVVFLAAPFAMRFLADEFGDRVRPLGFDGPANVTLWQRSLRELRPHAVVFADYPLMFWRNGMVPLAREPGWRQSLDDLDTCLVTLDHFGFAQGEMSMFFGPPHRSSAFHRFDAIPERMNIMLPCPMHEPLPVPGRKGRPFRYWTAPLTIGRDERAAVRARYLRGADELLVFHTVSNWAWKSEQALEHHFYATLSELFAFYLGSLGRCVTVLSLNNGDLLAPSSCPDLKIVNLATVSPPEMDRLMFSADLVLTENQVSISLGKAVCGLQPAAAFRNGHGILDLMDRASGKLREIVLAIENARPGSIYPFEVYPTGMGDILEEIVLYRDSSLRAAFERLEVFGGEETRRTLAKLLTDEETRAALQARQRAYVDRLATLPRGAEVLGELAAAAGPGR
jgi:hypothetical protein